MAYHSFISMARFQRFSSSIILQKLIDYPHYKVYDFIIELARVIVNSCLWLIFQSSLIETHNTVKTILIIHRRWNSRILNKIFSMRALAKGARKNFINKAYYSTGEYLRKNPHLIPVFSRCSALFTRGLRTYLKYKILLLGTPGARDVHYSFINFAPLHYLVFVLFIPRPKWSPFAFAFLLWSINSWRRHGLSFDIIHVF